MVQKISTSVHLLIQIRDTPLYFAGVRDCVVKCLPFFLVPLCAMLLQTNIYIKANFSAPCHECYLAKHRLYLLEPSMFKTSMLALDERP